MLGASPFESGRKSEHCEGGGGVSEFSADPHHPLSRSATQLQRDVVILMLKAAQGPEAGGEACGGRPAGGRGGVGSNNRQTIPHNNQHNPQYASYRAPLTQKQHHKAHRPQRPTERSDPTQHAKGRTGDRPGPREEPATRCNVTRGGGVWWP